jgi:rubrerythrin
MIRRLKRVLAADDPCPLRECRDCGTTVETAAVGCPVCGSGEIATYEV